jgi:protein ImuB
MQQVSRRRYLALWMPFLPIDRWRMMQVRGATAPADLPIAFVAKHRGAMRLMAVSPAALALGLAPGMALADARSQIPDLTTVAHEPAEDELWLEQLADHCRNYTPSVAIDLPDAIVLDITGCTHLFGDEADLISDIEASLAGVHTRIAAAFTPEAALALARFASPGAEAALETLPVAALRLDEATETALRRAGLVTIGDLAHRPTAPLAARFGDQAVAALDRLLGRRDSRIVPRIPDAPLVVEMRFAEPLVQAEAALSALDALVAEAAIELTQRGCGGRRFAARLYRSDGAKTDLAVETGQPTRDSGTVTRLFRERIEGLADPLDPGFGFDMITLTVLALEPMTSAQLSLEGGSRDEEVLAALVDRLGARLGRHRIRRFAPCDSHIPERAFRTFPAIAAPNPSLEWPSIRRGDPPRRPLHLFNPPERIDVIASVPDGPPRHFLWRRQEHRVTRHEGPERIAGEWWHLGKTAPTRDYYRVEDVNGGRFWIFRDGLYDGSGSPPAWYLHGLFA